MQRKRIITKTEQCERGLKGDQGKVILKIQMLMLRYKFTSVGPKEPKQKSWWMVVDGGGCGDQGHQDVSECNRDIQSHQPSQERTSSKRSTI